jgi:zinc/manganese transport system substrate-binding protein
VQEINLRREIDMGMQQTTVRRGIVVGAVALTAAVSLAGCGTSGTSSGSSTKGKIAVVAAENEYGSVASQIGGQYVSVTSVESNPNTDPHTYEVSPGVAQAVSAAQVVIQNGVGYDDYMTKIESASPNSKRDVLNVQQLLGLPNSTPNPHLWYNPTTMPKVADALASDFGALDPGHAAYFKANAATFITSLNPWLQAIAHFKATYPNTPVATTEPVADYMLQAAGADNLTPFTFQADIMNGVDPSPQDVSLETSFFTQHKVKVFVYNQQVTDSLTQSFITTARKAGVPVIGVYETMPVPGYNYQTWMLAEVNALQKAVVDHTSTTRL